MKTQTLKTRRQFLRTSVLGGSLAWTVPGFIEQTICALHAQAAGAGPHALSGKDAPILVVMQLAGGNDGLNTVIPTGNDFYHKARPRLAVSKDQALALNDELALHGSMKGFKALFDDGHLAIVNGAGYPNPNRSHFRSTEIWHTACDAEKVERHGWLGRYFDNQCQGCDPTIAVNVGKSTPQAFAARTPTGISLSTNPGQYRLQPASPKRGRGADDTIEQFYRELNHPETGPGMSGDDAAAGGTIGAVGGATTSGLSSVDFLERTALDAIVSSDRILEITRKTKPSATYPQSQIAAQFQLVSQLIAGGLESRVYYVSQGGYDTHTQQAGTQPRLLGEVSDALKAFADDLAAQGNLDRVLVMTFSEFGRRVAENASGGTDHGTAAPMFLVGGRVKAGLHGKYPSLDPKDLDRGDLQHNVDFRSVYAEILERWLRCPPAPILGRKFPALGCVV